MDIITKNEKSIFLLGFMGSGKSTVSKILAEKLGWKLIDMDERIVAEQKMSINDIFAQYGEEHFRKLETSLLQRLVEGTPAVISCGGGLPLREKNRQIIKENGLGVLLTASPETIYKRLIGDDQRPLLKDSMTVEHIAEMLESRKAAYDEVAHIVVDTENKSPLEVCNEILKAKKPL